MSEKDAKSCFAEPFGVVSCAHQTPALEVIAVSVIINDFMKNQVHVIKPQGDAPGHVVMCSEAREN